jgi:dipeptidase E
MKLILTSDFPTSAHPKVVERISAAAREPRIAWIPPDTDGGEAHFDDASRRFAALGFERLEYCDIDRRKDDVELAYLHEFDVVYLSGGDPLKFRYNMLRAGLGGRLRQCFAAGRLIVAASGGALLLTPNVSLFRLESESVDDVLATRGRFDALTAVRYEFLPHVNRLDDAMLDKVRQYAGRVDAEVIGVADGGALVHGGTETFEPIGEIVRFR